MRSPRAVAAFLALLILPQAYALARQFRLGFRPLGRAATRVPLSWDMFATSIERCGLTWSPPAAAPSGRPASLRDPMPRLEWDIVGDSAEQYEQMGRMGCARAAERARVELRCARPDGTWEERGFDCP
jgi:hypothetical protein